MTGVRRGAVVRITNFYHSQYARQRDATAVLAIDSFKVTLGDDVGSQ